MWKETARTRQTRSETHNRDSFMQEVSRRFETKERT